MHWFRVKQRPRKSRQTQLVDGGVLGGETAGGVAAGGVAAGGVAGGAGGQQVESGAEVV